MSLLSATDRIIREAEAAEARKSASGEPAQDGVVPAGPEPSGALPELMTGPMTEPVTEPTFAGAYPDYDDLSDGITRVDLNRSALALEKLRAFDAQSPAGGVRQAGLGTGRSPSQARPQPASTAVRPTAESELASRPRRGPPPGRPALSGDASWPELPGPRTPPAALPAVAAPTAEPPVAAHRSQSISLRHSPRVGRRVGLVIAAVTAAAVAPLVGSWTARFESAASARGGAEAPSIGATLPSSPPAGAARRPTAAMVVPSAAPDPVPGGPAPTQQPTLSVEPSGKTSGSSPDSPESASSPDVASKDRLLASAEPRPVHKSSGGKKSRRRARQTNVSSAPAPRAAAPRAAGPSPVGPSPVTARHDPRTSADPDDTLPIAIQ